MKAISEIPLILSLLFIFISSSFSNLSSLLPVIKFDGMNYDFGDVKQGENLEYVFKFTNSGKGRLLITSVQPSCGCTGVVMDEKKEYESGEEGEIKITFNTQGRLGVNTKTVSVNTNDPENPVITLTFKCKVVDNN